MKETLETIKDVLTNMPNDATGVRINRGWGIFYRLDELEKTSKFTTPHRYLRYRKAWVPVAIKSWKDFTEDNQVMNAFNFRFLAHRQFFIDLKGMGFTEKVIRSVPDGATHYNYMSNMYYRNGNIFAEFWTDDHHLGWCESTMKNEEAEKLLICLSDLVQKYEQRCL